VRKILRGKHGAHCQRDLCWPAVRLQRAKHDSQSPEM
jgi:hypothetical protein